MRLVFNWTSLTTSFLFSFFFLLAYGSARFITWAAGANVIKCQCHDPFMPHYEKVVSFATILPHKHSLPCQQSYPVTLSARGSRPRCVTLMAELNPRRD